MQARAKALAVLVLSVLPHWAAAQHVSSLALSELAPTGKLRVAIHYANELLVTKNVETGEPRGVAIDLARELGRRIGVPVEFVPYANANRLTRAASSGEWDVSFQAAVASRASDIVFSPGFFDAQATYLLPAGSSLRSVAEVDRLGVRVAVPGNSALDGMLTAMLKYAQLVRAPGFDGAAAIFVSDRLDALAGLRPRLLKDAENIPGSRVLDGAYAILPQAMGVSKGRVAAARYVHEFVEEVKASGFVAAAIEKAALRGVALAPKATAD